MICTGFITPIIIPCLQGWSNKGEVSCKKTRGDYFIEEGRGDIRGSNINK